MTVAAAVAIGVLAVAAAALSVRRPLRTVLAVYAATLPIASVVKLDVPLPSPFNTLSSLIGGAAIAACLAHLALYQRGRVPSIAVGAWLLFLGWASATALWSIAPSTSLSTVLVAIPLVLLMAVVAMVPAERTDLDVLRIAIIGSGIIVGAYALYLLLTGAALPTHGVSQRFSISTENTDPNILAASLLMPLILSVERVLLGGTRWWSARAWRLLGGAGTFFSFLAIVLTGSRGGLVAAGIAFVITLVTCRALPHVRWMVRRVVGATVALILAAMVVLVLGRTLSPGSAVGRILSSDALRRIVSTENGSSGRFEIWQAGYLACRAHCGTGAGLGAFPAAYNQTFAFSSASKNVGQNRPAHDIYLELAVETGFGGITLLALALLAEGRAVSRRAVHVEAPTLKAVLVGLLVANVFLSAIWFKYFWLVFTVFRVAEGALDGETNVAPVGGRPRLSDQHQQATLAAGRHA
jgi:O-antigen ligase